MANLQTRACPRPCRVRLLSADAAWRRSFDKGCVKNMREFVMAPPEARDRDVEYNDSVSVPLLETELTQLLSGGRSAATIVPISLMGSDSSDVHNSNHNS